MEDKFGMETTNVIETKNRQEVLLEEDFKVDPKVKETFEKAFNKQKITIKGKEYSFFKPKAVQIIRLEDECVGIDGSTDFEKMVEKHLQLVDRSLKLEIFDDPNLDNKLKVGDKVFTLKDKRIRKKLKIDSVQINKGKLDRISAVAAILDNCVEDVSLDSLTYSEINGLLDAYDKKVNTSEAFDALEKIKGFLDA